MRLQRAIAMSNLQGEHDFGVDEQRREQRRRRRQKRRSRRRSNRAERHRSRAERLDEGGSRRRHRRPEGGQPGQGRPERRRPGKTSKPRQERALQPWDQGEADLQPAPDAWEPSWDEPEVLDVDWEELPEPEWMGAARSARLPARWSPPAKLGRNLRLQASQGHRAAVIELKPGLYLVAELPEQVARSEFGVAAVLAPLVVKAASKAIQRRQQTPPTERPLYRLLHREQGQDQGQPSQGQPLRRLLQRPDGQVQDEQGRLLYRVFHPKQAQAQPQPQPQAAQLPALQLAPGAGHGVRALLPPPELGWADEVVLEPVGVHRG